MTPPLRLNLTTGQAYLEDRLIHISPREWQVLVHLVVHAGRTVTREQVMRDAWGETWWPPNSKIVNVYIGRLRHRLGDDAAKPRFITTVARVGYRFVDGMAEITEPVETVAEQLTAQLGAARRKIAELEEQLAALAAPAGGRR